MLTGGRCLPMTRSRTPAGACSLSLSNKETLPPRRPSRIRIRVARHKMLEQTTSRRP